jgi:thymidine phosphorylase
MVLAGMDTAPEVAAVKLRDALQSGQAVEVFERMVAAMGGPVDFASTWAGRLPEANVIREITASDTGVISAIDGHAIGMAVVSLGGGRMRARDRIDPSVGFSDIAALGTAVTKGDVIARLHAASEKAAVAAERSFRRAVAIGEAAAVGPLMIDRVG